MWLWFYRSDVDGMESLDGYRFPADELNEMNWTRDEDVYRWISFGEIPMVEWEDEE